MGALGFVDFVAFVDVFAVFVAGEEEEVCDDEDDDEIEEEEEEGEAVGICVVSREFLYFFCSIVHSIEI